MAANVETPGWSSQLFVQLGAIQSGLTSLDRTVGDLVHELDDLRRTSVPIKEHEAVMAQVAQLWEERARAAGREESRRRSENSWRRGLVASQLLLAILEIAGILYAVAGRVHLGGP